MVEGRHTVGCEVKLFRKSREPIYGSPLCPEEHEVFRAVLSGEGGVFGVLYEQLLSPLVLGFRRMHRPDGSHITSVLDEAAVLEYRLPAAPAGLVQIDDLMVVLAGTREIAVTGFISNGLMAGIRLSPPLTEMDWPLRLQLTDRRYRHLTGNSWLPNRDPQYSREVERQLQPTPSGGVPPEYLTVVGLARSTPLSTDELNFSTTPEFVEYARWVEPTRAGGVQLFSGNEIYGFDDGNSDQHVVGTHLDGSAYVRTVDGAVVWHALDGTQEMVASSLRDWLEMLMSQDPPC